MGANSLFDKEEMKRGNFQACKKVLSLLECRANVQSLFMCLFFTGRT